MSEEIISNENKKYSPSQELLDAIEMLAYQSVKTKEQVETVIRLAKKDDIPNILLRELVQRALQKRGLATRTITRYLPDELKDQSKVRKLADKIVSNDDKKELEKSDIAPTPTEFRSEELVIKEPVPVAPITKDDWKKPLGEAVEERMKEASIGSPEEYKGLLFEIEGLKKEVTTLQGIINLKEDSIAALNTRIESMDTLFTEKNSEIIAKNKEIEGLRAEVEYYKGLSNDKTTITKIEATTNNPVDQDERITKLRDTNIELKKKLDTMNPKTRDERIEYARLSHELDENRNKIGSLLKGKPV